MKHVPWILLAAACASAPAEENWVFVQSAERAEISGGTLTLHGASASVECFTERPERRTAKIALEDFLAGWSEGGVFQNDPPRATLTIFDGLADGDVILVLRRPRLSGRTLTFDVDLLDGSAARSGSATLFIDGGGSIEPAVQRGSREARGLTVRRRTAAGR